MKKVLYTTNLPVPYKLDFFKELGKYVDLTVVFERKTASDRETKWLSCKINGFKAFFMKDKACGNENAFCPEISKIIKTGKYDEIVIGAYYTPTGMFAIQYLKAHKIEYYISSDGGFIKEDNILRKKIKTHFIKGAKGYFSPSMKTDKYLEHYGAKSDLIYRYPFTSLKHCDLINSLPGKSQKDKLRRSLGVNEEKMIIGVGQFIQRKGWDVLMKAATQLPDNTGVYIIGGKATQEYLDLKNKLRLDNIYFLDFKQKDILKNYFIAADIFVLPTREDIWGLVVNEAMGYGLPVITTENCMAGLEIVKNGLNGYIIPVNNPIALTEKLNELLEDSDKCIKMGERSLEYIKEFSIERMAMRYANILDNRERIL